MEYVATPGRKRFAITRLVENTPMESSLAHTWRDRYDRLKVEALYSSLVRSLGALQRNFFQTSEITMEVGG